MPLVAGVVGLDRAHRELRHAEGRRVVARAEDQRLDAVRGVGDARAVRRRRARVSICTSSPIAPLEPELALELREQVVERSARVGALDLGQHDAVERAPGAARRRSAMSRKHQCVSTALTRTTFVSAVHSWPRQRVDDVLPRGVVLLERRDGVLEVEEDLVGGQARGLGEHLRARSGDGETGAAQAHGVPGRGAGRQDIQARGTLDACGSRPCRATSRRSSGRDRQRGQHLAAGRRRRRRRHPPRRRPGDPGRVPPARRLRDRRRQGHDRRRAAGALGHPHAGPGLERRDDGEEELLRPATCARWRSPRSWARRSVAFPAISTGIYGYPVELAAPVAVAAVREAAAPPVELVRFVLFSEGHLAAFRAAL